MPGQGINKRVGHYEIADLLGKGGFGEVYRAIDTRDNSIVAVKYLYSDRQPERFLREARVLKRSSHPHIVRYIDFTRVEDETGIPRCFIIMEFLDGMPGCSLKDRIQKSPGGLDTIETMALFSRYLDAVQQLHDLRIIHRDIKPGNLYAPEHKPDSAKIFDLGIAKDISGTVTSGQIPGTLDYMAPEFALRRGARGSPRSDIYSAGLSFYEALTGKPVFPKLGNGNENALFEFIDRAKGLQGCAVDYECRPFRKFPELAGIVKKAVEIDPHHRYRSAAGMKADIDRILAGAAGEGAVPSGIAARKSRPTLMRRISRHISEAIPPRSGLSLPRQRPAANTPAGEQSSVSVESSGLSGTYRMVRALCWGTAVLAILAAALTVSRQISLRRAHAFMSVSAEERVVKPLRTYMLGIKDHLDIVTSLQLKDSGRFSRWEAVRQDLEALARKVPGLFNEEFDRAVSIRDKPAAAALAEEWAAMADLAPAMGQCMSEHAEMMASMNKRLALISDNAMLTAIENDVPAVLSAENLGTVEELASRYVQMLDEEDVKRDAAGRARLKNVAGRIAKAADGYNNRLREAALMWYSSGKDANGDAKLKELEDFGRQAPILAGFIADRYSSALAEVRAAAAVEHKSN